jgi:hypothetical protein
MPTKKDLLQYALIFLVALWPLWLLVFALTREVISKIISLVRGRKTARPVGPIIALPSEPADKPAGLS